MDFSKIKFRSSELGYLMTEARGTVLTDLQAKTLKELEEKKAAKGLTEKQEQYLQDLIAKRDAPPELSETTKDYLREVYIREVFKREKDITSKFLEKGNFVEEASLTLMSKYYGRLILKHKSAYENDYITGHPDVLDTVEEIIDNKSSWDIWSFAKADGTNKIYYWQLQGYMWLTNKTKASLFYGLIDTPDHLVYDELRRQSFKLGIMDTDEKYLELEETLEKNLKYPDIEPSNRAKVFRFEYDPAAIQRLKERIDLCRQYLNNFKWV